MSTTDVCVMFACNSDRNGVFLGRCDAVHIDDECIRLHGPWLRLTEPTKDRPWLRFGRRRFGTLGWKEWVGNWCWNAAWMSRDEARRLVAYALKRGFDAEENPLEGPFADLFA